MIHLDDCILSPSNTLMRFPFTGGCLRDSEGHRLPGRTIVSFRAIFNGFFSYNNDPAHFVVMVRATDPAIDTGRYQGHGLAAGKLYGNIPMARIESWGPQYNPNGPGGNILLPNSESPMMRDGTWYDITVQSLLSANLNKYVRYNICEPNQVPLMDTGDVLDDNAAVDMDSESVAIAAIFNPVHPDTAGNVALSRFSITHIQDSVPLPDMRRVNWNPSGN